MNFNVIKTSKTEPTFFPKQQRKILTQTTLINFVTAQIHNLSLNQHTSFSIVGAEIFFEVTSFPFLNICTCFLFLIFL